MVEKCVVSGELAKDLNKADREDGPTIRLVSPQLLGVFPEGRRPLQSRCSSNVIFDNLQLEPYDLK